MNLNRKPEIWVKIIGYEDRYSLSSYGKILSIRTDGNYKPKILRNNIDKDGYCVVQLCRNGIIKVFKVHRLVGFHFLKNNNLKEINHKNGVKSDNYFENLEWCTRRENSIHALITGLRPYTTDKQRAAVTANNIKRKGIKYGVRTNNSSVAARH